MNRSQNLDLFSMLWEWLAGPMRSMLISPNVVGDSLNIQRIQYVQILQLTILYFFLMDCYFTVDPKAHLCRLLRSTSTVTLARDPAMAFHQK